MATASSSSWRTIGAAVVALGLTLVLVDLAVETVRSGSPVRWWVAAAVIVYLAIGFGLWQWTRSRARQFGWSGSAAAAAVVLFGLLAGTAWLPGGLTDGVTAMRQPTGTLLSAVVAATTILAGAALVLAPTWMPRWGRAVAALLACYAVIAFGVGIATGTPFVDLFHGASVWLRAPFWLQGAFLGAVVVIPLGLIAILAGSRIAPRASWKWRQGLFLGLGLSIAAAGVLGSGRSQLASASQTPPSPAAVKLAQTTVAAAMTPQNLAGLLDDVERSAAAVSRSALDVDAKAAELGPDVATMFAFVRDRVRQQVYEGVLRGPRGALLARAGNAWDKSLLLGALLKHHGVEVRFVRGHLDADAAARLVSQMFTAFTQPALEHAAARVESAPASLRTAGGALSQLIAGEWSANSDATLAALTRDGLHLGGQTTGVTRATLVAEAADHLWVEYHQGDRWLSLDPSFSDAQPGRTFAQPADTVSDVPRSFYHRIVIRQEIEERTGGALTARDVLRYESTAADLNATAVTLRYDLSAKGLHWYATPILQAGGARTVGETFGGEAGLGNAVAGALGDAAGLFTGETSTSTTNGITAASIVFELTTPSGRSESIRREVFDRIGVRARVDKQESTAPLDPFAETAGVPGPLSNIFACWFNAGPAHPDLALTLLAPELPALRSATAVLTSLQTSGRAPTDEEQRTLAAAFDAILPAELSATAASFYSLSESSRVLLRPGKSQVWFYEATPRLAIVSFGPITVDGGKTFVTRTSIDLRRNDLRAVSQEATPTQVASANFSRGVLDAVAEHVLSAVVAKTPTVASSASTITLMDNARNAGIAMGTLRDRGSIGTLQASDSAKARMLSTLADDRVFVAPVSLGDGEPLGWWQVDLATGETVGVIDSGLHGVTIIEWVQTNAIYVAASTGNALSASSTFMQLAFFVEVAVVLAAMAYAAAG